AIAQAQATTLLDLAWFGFLALLFLAICRKRSWRAAEIVFFSYKNPLWIHSPSGRAPPPKVAA
ncbi:MAG: hypothetical protein J2P13_11295, partial [Acidobacteria bacterium]|nr:hypothetical protein [Acidobacteriota bacterium]